MLQDNWKDIVRGVRKSCLTFYYVLLSVLSEIKCSIDSVSFAMRNGPLCLLCADILASFQKYIL